MKRSRSRRPVMRRRTPGRGPAPGARERERTAAQVRPALRHTASPRQHHEKESFAPPGDAQAHPRTLTSTRRTGKGAHCCAGTPRAQAYGITAPAS
ncbi:hypothetical protein V7F55_004825 [Escherichia coli]|nr:hypothetical protein [Escherichia coli]EKC8295918.1 hypothetical protein [Escherichia coli]